MAGTMRGRNKDTGHKWLATKSRPMTREIYDLFHVIRFFDPAVLGSYAKFTKFFVNRILQN